MAIQNRRGNYSDFDSEKMVPGEWATVLSGDPNAGDGKSIYHCFSAGNVKRMATYEDMEDNIEKATDDIREQYLQDISQATQSANTAASSANQAAQSAQRAAQDAQNAAEAIEGAVEGTIINDQTPSSVTAFSGKHVDDTYLDKKELNSALEWKAAGDVTGTSVITLNNWNELSVLIIGSDSNYYSLHIIKSMMISTGRRFRTGYYFSDNKYAGLELSIGSTGVRIAELFENGVSKTSSARLLAWYR